MLRSDTPVLVEHPDQNATFRPNEAMFQTNIFLALKLAAVGSV
jgi:hypothetical protein